MHVCCIIVDKMDVSLGQVIREIPKAYQTVRFQLCVSGEMDPSHLSRKTIIKLRSNSDVILANKASDQESFIVHGCRKISMKSLTHKRGMCWLSHPILELNENMTLE